MEYKGLKLEVYINGQFEFVFILDLHENGASPPLPPSPPKSTTQAAARCILKLWLDDIANVQNELESSEVTLR